MAGPDEQDEPEITAIAWVSVGVLIVALFVLFAAGAGFLVSVFGAMGISLATGIALTVRSTARTPEERRRAEQASGWLLPADADVAMNEGPGTFAYDVVGESHHLDALQAIVTEEGLDLDQPGQLACQAFLLCEPDNPHDPNAVAVVISLRRVGYIPRDDAAGLAPKLRELANSRVAGGRGGQVLCVQARIGWQERGRIGVRLDLETD